MGGNGRRERLRVGTFGIEIDKTASSSPRGTRVVAHIPNLYGPGMTAQMTYYRTSAGAKVFAAGAFTLAGSATRPYGERLLDNLWRHMAGDSDTLSSSWSFASTTRRRPLEAAFARESYRPGAPAQLGIWGSPSRLVVQIFRTGPERRRTARNDELNGVPASKPIEYAGRRRLTIRIGNWATGMYFAKVRASDGRVAYAPFVVRPDGSACIAWPSSCRRTPGRPTTSATTTATVRPTPGTPTARDGLFGWRGRSLMRRPDALPLIRPPFLHWLAWNPGRWTTWPSRTSSG